MHYSTKGRITFAFFTIIAITIGVLTVCFTSSNRQSKQCRLVFKSAGGNSIGYYSQPRFVAVGDFNNDTWLDIVVANYGIDSVGVFLGVGNGTFASQQLYSTGLDSRPYSVAIGDFNNDNRLDIAVASYGTNSICILFGYGNGSFGNQSTLPLGSSRPIFITVGNFNNDHSLDIAVANSGTSNIGILLGYGNGSFRIQIPYSTGYDSFPHSIAVGDFNNDHRLDIVVANYGTGTVGIFLGFGNGSFVSQKTFPTGLHSNPCSVAVGDFNDDNYLDIVTSNSGTDNVGVLIGYGNGTFATQRTYFISSGSRPSFVTIADFNNDHRLDIAVSDAGIYNINVFLGYGNGTFASSTTHLLSSQSSPFGIATGDFDKDNQSDIVVANFDMNTIHVLADYASRPSNNPPTYSTGNGSAPCQVLIRDFNNDTCLDLAVVNSGTNNIGIFLGDGNGTFAEETMYSTGDPSGPISFAINDFNNDNQLDIVVCNFFSNTLGFIFGYGNGTFELSETYSTGDGSRPISVAVGDFSNDNILDIIVANYGSDSIAVFLGYGNGSFGILEIYSSGYASGPIFISFDDFNHDNQLDIVAANYNINNVGIFLGYGNGTFAPLMTFSVGSGSLPNGLAVGDLNNDGCEDIAVASFASNNVVVLLGYCNGTFANQISFPTGPNSNPYSVAVGDLNNDNRLDVVSANNGGNSVTVLLASQGTNDANLTIYSTNTVSQSPSFIINDFKNGTHLYSVVTTANKNGLPVLLLGNYYSDFQRETIYSTGSGSHPYSVAVGDFNGDSLLDIAVANSGSENIGIYLGYGNASFASERKYWIGSGSRPQNLIVTNISQGISLHIIVTNPIQDSITVLKGDGNGTFSIETTIPTGYGSNPSSIVSGYVNNDHFLDLVVANPGTETIGLVLGFHYAAFQTAKKYSTGDFSNPLSFAIGDLNNDNQLDIAVANYLTHNIGVLLGFGNGSFAQQTTHELMIGSHPMRIALGDFNNDTYLDIATANWAANSIGVLLGYGNGNFTTPLYYTTGFATRPTGISVGDFNNDNCLDIVVTNYGTNNVSVFLGYGNGTFENFTMYSTEPSSAPKSVTIYDLNNDNNMDIIVSNQGTDDIGILFGYGNGTFANIATYSTGIGSAPYYTAVTDLNNDSRPDIVIACLGNGNIGILFGYNNGSFAPVVTYTTGFASAAAYVTIGDFNNDNNLDIIAANCNNGYISIFFGYGNGHFTSVVLYPNDPLAALYSLGIGDFNNDTRLDIAYIDAINNNVGVRLGSGISYFGGQTALSMTEGSKPSSVTVGDFNNDQWLDIAVANYGTNNIGVLLGHGDGSFENMKTFSTGNNSRPLSIAVNDLNNDTLLDIVVVNSETSNVAIFFGYGNGSFTDVTLYSTGIGSYPVSVLIGDLNSNKWLDIVVANFDTNNLGVFIGLGNGTFTNQKTYSVGYGNHPNWIAFGNFNNDSSIDIAVANYDNDTVLILLKMC